MKTLIKSMIVAGALMALATASMAQAAGPRGGAGAGQARQGGPGGGGAQMMKQREEMMKKIFDQLNLTADQKKKVEALNKDRAAKMQKMFAQGGGPGGPGAGAPKPGAGAAAGGNTDRRAAMQKMTKEYEESLKKIIGDAKFAQYQKLLKEAREKMRAGGPGGGAGAGAGARKGGGGGGGN